MAKQSAKQKEVVGRVMHEFKHGELEKRDGAPVKNPKQAIAIALHEAGATNQVSPQKNKTNLRKAERRDQQGRTTKAQKEKEGGAKPSSKTPDRSREELYAEAKRHNIPGRSKMSKPELERALHA